ncbi:MAG: hypothetical protein H6553_04135 [Chitinophagales bacterium]|nr:hypothetical protein [Chitinophagales bacterium]
MGNRIAKIYKNKLTIDPTTGYAVDDSTYKVTWYWRDAQGNILATETEREPQNLCYTGMPTETQCQTKPANEIEYVIYGSSRLGVYHDSLNYSIPILSPFGQYVRQKTLRQYELSNHLGNVMTTLSDVKYYEGNSYKSHILTTQDYYPFGMQLVGRTYDACEDQNAPSHLIAQRNTYLFGFNGAEKVNEIKGQGNSYDFGARIYDSRLGRFLSIDPLYKNFPSESNYSYAGNSPLLYIDEEGAKKTLYIYIKDYSGSVTKMELIDNKDVRLKVYNSYYGGAGLYSADVEQDLFIDFSDLSVSLSKERFSKSDISWLGQKFKNLNLTDEDGVQPFGYNIYASGGVPSASFDAMKGKADVVESFNLSEMLIPSNSEGLIKVMKRAFKGDLVEGMEDIVKIFDKSVNFGGKLSKLSENIKKKMDVNTVEEVSREKIEDLDDGSFVDKVKYSDGSTKKDTFKIEEKNEKFTRYKSTDPSKTKPTQKKP